MRKAGSGLADPDTIKNKLDNYARVAQLALKWNKSPVHWRGLNRAIISYCAHNKESVPDWKNLGFVQLKPFLKHLASQNHIHFVGDHLVHPDNEGAEVDIVGYDEEEASDDTEPVLNRSTSSGILTHAKAISSPKLKKSGSFSTGNDGSKLVGCPICQKMVAEGEVNRHLDECLNLQLLNNEQQNGGNIAANNGAVPNNNNPRLERAAAVALQDDEEDAAPATRLRLGHRGLGKRRRSSGVRKFAPNKRARFIAMEEEEDEEDEHNEEEEEEEENPLVNNNNRLRMIADQIRTMHQQQAAARLAMANQTNQVHLSDDSDAEDNDDNAQGGGDSRFAEKILDRNLTDKDCIICYMPLERGQLVATMRCFCQFHKACLLDWFEKREVCPTHSEMSM
jgi:hypothetical protein